MFLTSKKGGLVAKGKHTKNANNSKALGGWGDEDGEDDTEVVVMGKKDKNKTTNLLDEGGYDLPPQVPDYQTGFMKQAPLPSPIKKTPANKKPQQTFYNIEQLQQMQNIQCQLRLVDSISEPSGIRLKPTEIQLQEFQKECKALNINIIGSLLIARLYDENSPLQSRTKALYTIEYLAKKNIQYSVYFKLNGEEIRGCPEGLDEGQDNYVKVKRNVLIALGILGKDGEQEEREFGVAGGYEDHGEYARGDDLGVKEIVAKKKKKLVSPDEMGKNKKVLSGPKGPTSSKPKKQQTNTDLLTLQPQTIKEPTFKQETPDIDLLGMPTNEGSLLQASSQQKQKPKKQEADDLLGFQDQNKKEEESSASITFDELMKGTKKGGGSKKQDEFDFRL